MNKMLPGYTFKNVSEMFKQEGFQMKYDARHGYCVTWSILYIHYRLLNRNIKINIMNMKCYGKHDAPGGKQDMETFNRLDNENKIRICWGYSEKIILDKLKLNKLLLKGV